VPIQINFDAAAALAALSRASARVRRQGPVVMQVGMLQVGRIYLRDMARRFDRLSAGAPGWRPLAPATLAQKRTNRKLYETGELRRSLNPGAPYNVLRATPRSIRAATSHPLARIHHFGTAHIPARPIMVQPSADALRQMRYAVQNAAQNVMDLVRQDLAAIGNRAAGMIRTGAQN
jgi:hypothetical protein